MTQLLLCLESHKEKIKVFAGLGFFLDSLRPNLLQNSVELLAGFWSFFLRAVSHSLLLDAVCIPPLRFQVASFQWWWVWSLWHFEFLRFLLYASPFSLQLDKFSVFRAHQLDWAHLDNPGYSLCLETHNLNHICKVLFIMWGPTF